MKKLAPRVSVLMPVFQADKFLASSIKSILNQSYSDFELLILCDDSGKDTKKILERYSNCDPRIKLHYLGGIGLVESLNYGLGIARGEYIARMDADDISSRKRFEIQVRFMDDNPLIGLCGSRVRTFGHFPSKIWRYPVNNSELQCRLFFGSFFAHPSVMIRKQVLEMNHLRYDPALNFAEDYDLWTRLRHFTKIENLPTVLLLYRINPVSVQTKNKNEQKKSLKKIYSGLLHEIGIDANDQELELHYKILKECVWVFNQKNEIYKNDYDIKKSYNWLKKIYDSNLEVRQYDGKIFARLVSELFFNICYRYGKPGLSCLNRFMASPITKSANFSFIKKTEFAAKYFIKLLIPEKLLSLLPEL